MKSLQKLLIFFALFFALLAFIIGMTGGTRFSVAGISISMTSWNSPLWLCFVCLGIKLLYQYREPLKARRKKFLFASILISFFLLILGILGEFLARYYLPPDPYSTIFQINPHPWIQFSLVPSVKTSVRIDNGTKVPFQVNSLGYRGPEIGEKKLAQQRVICLGDSFLMGKDVADQETLPAKLQHFLGNNAQVINAGCGGWNTVQEYYDLKERGLALQPDSVLLFYVMNDTHFRKKLNLWRRLKETVTLNSALYRFLRTRWIQWEERLRSQVSVALETNPSSNEEALLENPTQASMKDWNEDFQEGKKGWESSKEALQNIQSLCRERNIPFLIILYPWLVQLDENYPFKPVHEKLSQFCHQQEIPFLDLFPYYKGYSAKELWVGRTDSHPNVQGQEIAAKAVAQKLQQLGWLKK